MAYSHPVISAARPSPRCRVAILGASGYTGAELLRLCAQHPHFEVVAATGDTQVGVRAASLYPSLAAHYPELTFSAFDDADVELAAATLRAASFWNAGQDCTAACRVIAGPKVYERLVAELAAQVKTIKVGPTADKATEMGPLISASQRARVKRRAAMRGLMPARNSASLA